MVNERKDFWRQSLFMNFLLLRIMAVLSPSLNRSLSQVTLLHVSYGLSCSETDDALLPDKGPIWLTVRQQNQWFLVEIQILENAL